MRNIDLGSSLNLISYICFHIATAVTLISFWGAKLEDYEQSNGMKPVWININEAIEFNQDTITNSTKKGMSVERELFLLKLIKKEFL